MEIDFTQTQPLYVLDIQFSYVVKRFLSIKAVIENFKRQIFVVKLDFHYAGQMLNSLRYQRHELNKLYSTVPVNEIIAAVAEVDILINILEDQLPKYNPDNY
jgi:hypothetical protein